MSHLLPKESLQDVLVYHNPDDSNEPKVRTVPAGKGDQIVDAHKEEARKRNQMRSFLMWIIILIVVGYALLMVNQPLLGILAAGVIYLVFRYSNRGSDAMVPKLLINNADRKIAPFEDATGAHAGALLGDVRHDPFQSGGMETPSHDRVEAGAIQKAHKGVLFIDEINTLDVRSQQKLMTAIQEGEFSITGQSERSSGAMVQTEPVPCDFIMVASGNMDAMENMHPRCAPEFGGTATRCTWRTLSRTPRDAPEVRALRRPGGREGRPAPGLLPEAVREVILEAKRRSGRKDHLTLKLRDLGGLVRVAGDIARSRDHELTTRDDVLQAKKRSRSIEQQVADDYIERRKEYELKVSGGEAVGRVNGLAVMGGDSGIMLPVMAEITPKQGEGGEVIATGQLKEMAEEAVDNVSAIIKKYSDQDISQKDIHIQFVQTGQGGVDGDSASITVATAVISALEDIPVAQDLAMTGSLCPGRRAPGRWRHAQDRGRREVRLQAGHHPEGQRAGRDDRGRVRGDDRGHPRLAHQ